MTYYGSFDSIFDSLHFLNYMWALPSWFRRYTFYYCSSMGVKRVVWKPILCVILRKWQDAGDW